MVKLSAGRRATVFLQSACLSCVLAGVPICAIGAGETERIEALERQLANSLARIEQLNARVSELERERRTDRQPAWGDAPSPAATRPAEQQQQPDSIAALRESVNQIAEGLSRASGDQGTPVHGFLDVDAGWSTREDPDRRRGFSAGSLDLYLTPQITSRVKALVELVLEFEEEGRSFDAERIQIGYTLNDTLTLWAGRFHTPFGLWNTSFHHGANLQTSISRPSFIEFEDRDGLIPAHSVGIWANGKVPLDNGRMSFDAYLANGPSVRDRRLDPNTANDNNGNKLIGANIGYEPLGTANGLRFGVHGFTTRVLSYDRGQTAFASTMVRMLGGYFGYEAYSWEALGEYYRFRDTDTWRSQRSNSQAAFVQVGRTFGATTPYLRVEHASLDPRDLYFRSQRTGRSYGQLVAGVRYALDSNASLKFEWRRSRDSAATLLDDNGLPVGIDPASYQRALLQFSAAF